MTAKRVELTQGQFAIVDDEDYEHLINRKWYAIKRGRDYVAVCHTPVTINKNRPLMLMHRIILNLKVEDKRVVDHINHNTLDNRKNNLRICTDAENTRNQRVRNITKTSKFKGASLQKTSKLWRSQIRFNYKNINLGDFKTQLQAARAYDKAAKQLHGEFACTNF
jgi:hypothetical protein